jgi:hypothetical protein
VIALDVALRIIRRRAAAAGVELILPGDPRREAIVSLVALGHSIQRTGVLRARVADGVTITLPGVPGPAAALLALIPYVGPALAALAMANGRTSVAMSPAALATGGQALATWWHEEGHVGSIARGGLLYCGAYLLAPEVRAGGEAPCYGAGIAVRVACGAPLDGAVRDALDSLEGYGLDVAAKSLASGIIASAAHTIRATGDYGGVVAELRAELAAEGVIA